jgi:hypothetical protein
VRPAVIVPAVAAAFAAASGVSAAHGAGWPLGLPTAGFCVPAPDDGAYVPRLVRALGIVQTPTKPIAILDTGVDPAIPQLAGRVDQGYDALTGAPVSDDPSGHGTQAAGLAASAGPGARGISPTSPILPIRIYDGNRASSVDSLSKGIALAVQKGAGVISISGSGPLSDASSGDVLKITKAIGDAISKGVLVFAGAGDDSGSVQTLPGGLPHVLVAGSATTALARASNSATGPWQDVLVPADGVSAPLPLGLCNLGFGFSSGTSFAAPSYAAAGAIVLTRRPGLTTQQHFELLRRAAVDIGPAGRDDDTGYGMLDVTAALSNVPLVKENSPEPDDDPYWVRGPYARAHPAFLTKKKLRFKALGSLSPAKDPADVYPVALRRRERMVVTVKASDPGALLELSILAPKAGDFDLSNGVDANRLVGTGGLSNDPQIEITANRAGTYYIAVEAADALDPGDPTAAVPDLEPYQVSAYKQHRTVKKPKRR